MQAASGVQFDWGSLPRLRSEEVAAAREARCRLAQYFELSGLPALVREVFAAELEGFGTAGGAFAAEAPPSLGADVTLVGSELELAMSVEPALVVLALNRVLGRAQKLTVERQLSPALRAAFHTVAGELCRRLAPEAALSVGTALGNAQQFWRIDFWVRVDGASYRGRLAVALRGVVPSIHGNAAWLRPSNGAVPVTLPLVLCSQTLAREQLASLELGDAVVFDADWAVLDGAASGVLCAGSSGDGLRVERAQVGWVLRGPAQVDYEVKAMAEGETTVKGGVEAAVLDTPVVVRLEVGEVTLTAREWLALGAGDVLQTDVPLGEPAALRVGGRVVARGTLVNVDGQLGVRILSLTSG